MELLQEIERDVSGAMRADRHALRRQLKTVRHLRKRGRPFDRALARLTERLQASRSLRAQRAALRPRPDWDEELPVVRRRQEIADAIRAHPVVIVCGETGSGKSTQLPRIALELGRGVDGVIGHTQPRRIAARSIAARLAEETGFTLGEEVGYRIRFQDSSSPRSLVRLMTDGILLAETQSDRFLDAYDTIIVDEAHERSLNIDFLLGYLKRLLRQRPDFRLIITSATIDAERFADHFAVADQPAPVIQVSGRTWPVEIRYRPVEAEPVPDAADGDSEPRDWLDAVADAVTELANIDTGHQLVFLPTERHIREASRVLSGRRFPGDTAAQPTEIVPLYGRLSMADQAKVFQPYRHRRIVLATNVAESSLTVPGIRYVVDTGTARISRYSARARMQRLPIEPVSRASADQRAGRCGRVGPGVCLRLFSEEDYRSREAFTAPEIQRTSLAAVILRTLHLNLGRLEDFPFLDPPRPTTVREGYKTLHELGATTDDGALTAVGRRMAPLPVDPRVARMILAAVEEQALPEVLVIAAALESQDPRDRPVDKQQAADEAHRKFRHPDSDFLTLLNLWDAFHEQKRALSGSQLRKWCRRNFLSWLRMREWIDVSRQLRDLLANSGDESLRKAAKLHPVRDRRNDFAAVHRSLLSGLLANVAMQTPHGDYQGTGGNRLALWPGSGLAPKGAWWLVAGELVETSQRFARTVARIQPEWIEPLAEHLVTRSYSEPHWDPEDGNARMFEKVALWGLPIVPRRRISCARVDPGLSRELLIRHGLVEFGLLFGRTEDDDRGEWEDEQEQLSRGTTRVTPGRSSDDGPAAGRRRGWGRDFPFLRHNHAVLQELTELQARTRRRDLIPSDDALFRHYDEQIPDDVVDRRRLRQWFRREQARQPDLLKLTVEQFTQADDGTPREDQFPQHLRVGSMTLPLTYQMTPGDEADGVSLTVPAAGLGQVTDTRLHWLVPGMLEPKVLALIRSLPRDLRRLFVPAPDTAAEVTRRLRFGEGDLLTAVAAGLTQIAGQPIDPQAFDLPGLPEHLRFRLRVLNDHGELLAEGRDLQALRGEVAAATASAVAQPSPAPEEAQWHRTGFTDWTFGDLPETIPLERNGLRLLACPALRDDGDSVALTLCQTAAEARQAIRCGLRRLVLLQERRRIRQQIENLPQIGSLRMLAAPIRGLDLQAQLSLLMADRAYLGDHPLPRNAAAFRELLARGRTRTGLVAQEFLQLLPGLFERIRATQRQLDATRGPGWDPVIAHLRQQLTELVHSTFLTSTPWPWLIQYPRYLAAMQSRLQRLSSGGLRTELSLMKELAPREDRWRQRRAEHQQQRRADPMLEHYRWMLEEYRVSLFAQKLGTAISISARKLDEQWERVT